VAELNEEFNLDIPEGDYETLAGFILEQLGRLPNPNDTLSHQDYQLTVLEMQGPRIKRVEITNV
jgi:CBS domain containing-hemolysin-like protein